MEENISANIQAAEVAGTPLQESSEAAVPQPAAANPGNTAITQATQGAVAQPQNMKFCKHCGGRIPYDAVLCTLCGRQVEELNQAAAPQVVINNSNNNVNTNLNAGMAGILRNKWVAFFLCLFLGVFGAHKFYEGKAGMGILYLFTLGLCGIGVLVDLIIILFKPRHYYVY